MHTFAWMFKAEAYRKYIRKQSNQTEKLLFLANVLSLLLYEIESLFVHRSFKYAT